METIERVKLAQYFNARGVRMLKCAGHVESCSHYKAFKAMADAKFSERDRHMEQARLALGIRKTFLYQVESLDFEGRHYDVFSGYDELDAGVKFEQQCECVGVDPGMYRAVRLWRVRP